MAKRLKYLVDGEWLETESGVYYEITNSRHFRHGATRL